MPVLAQDKQFIAPDNPTVIGTDFFRPWELTEHLTGVYEIREDLTFPNPPPQENPLKRPFINGLSPAQFLQTAPR